jgi:hypothetical protein
MAAEASDTELSGVDAPETQRQTFSFIPSSAAAQAPAEAVT